MKRTSGFTVIELMTVIVFLAIAATVLVVQKNNLSAAQRDNDRKVAINAMYYGLEEAFYPQNKYYPAKIDAATLKTVDPDLFTDPYGVEMNEPDANYRYEGTNCTDNKCKSYSLRTILEKEADYIKTNRVE